MTLGRGNGRLDLADGAGHGWPEVFGGREGLANLSGQAAPFGDGEWSGDAAQGDLHRNVVAADDQEHAQGWVVTSLVAARKSRTNGSLTMSRTASRSASGTAWSKVVRAGCARSCSLLAIIA